MRSRLAVPLLSIALALMATRAAGQASIVPEWVGRHADVLRGAREGTLPDTAGLRAAAPAVDVEAVDRALLLCRVEASESGPRGRWDTFADPDLRVELRVGRAHRTAWGTENSRTADVSFAGLAIRRGDRVEVRLWDRDVTGDERIATIATRFDGHLPLSLAQGESSFTCSLGDAARAAREVTAALDAAEPALALVEAAIPALADPALGRPEAATRTASENVVLAIAWGGFDEPRAHAMRERLRAGEASFDRALAAAVVAARRTPSDEPVPVPGTTTRVRVAGVLTSASAIRAAYPTASQPVGCVVELVLDPPAADPASLLGTPDCFDRHGGLVTSFGVERSSSDPARVGVPLPVRVRARDLVLRVGTGTRALLVPR